MPETWREVAFTGTPIRYTSQMVGTKLYVPGWNTATCEVFDTVTETRSSFALGVTARVRYNSVLYGTRIYTTHNGHGSVGVIETTTNTYTEVTIARRLWNGCVVVGTELFIVSGSSNVVGVLDLSTHAYSEFTVTTTRNRGKCCLVGGLVIAPSDGHASALVLNPSTRASTEVTAPAALNNLLCEPGDGVAFMNHNTTNAIMYAFNPATSAWTSIAMSGGSRTHSTRVGNRIYFHVGAWTDVVDATTNSVVHGFLNGATGGVRYTSRALGAKIYVPIASRAFLGIIENVPLPPPATAVGWVRGHAWG